MAHADIILPTEPTRELPAIRSIGPMDLRDALAKGLADFWAMPTHVVFLSLIYPVAGLALGRATWGYDVIPLLYPLAAGFALIGPFAAIGLYGVVSFSVHQRIAEAPGRGDVSRHHTQRGGWRMVE